MYKYMLCWRYLRTRWIALASVVSVMLGVATMIVVNSVMAGFSAKMRDRLHGVLADVIVESRDFDGFRNWSEVMARIDSVAGSDVVAMSPTMESPAMMKWSYHGNPITKPVQLIGIRPADRAKTGDFAEFLVDEKGRKIPPSFTVPDRIKFDTPAGQLMQQETDPAIRRLLEESVDQQASEGGVIIGYAMGHAHYQGKDYCIAPPGTVVGLVYPQAGDKPKVSYDRLPVIGYFKSGMSEYDSTHVYMPLEQMQKMRLLGDGQGNGAVSHIQVKARAGVDLDALASKIEVALEKLKPRYFSVTTWEHKQGALLAAVAVEQSILNILLFFIIAVAGFGILAIFSMIVVEKTRDIGVLKALGASTSGVRGIFLGYGLSLGIVGSGVGMVSGLFFVRYINEIEEGLSVVTHRRVFDPDIYYFDKIPTLVEPLTVAWIVGGALVIAIAASVWPAQRAARLRPVQALRFE
jgi:lipoprotein-releasing system permease protein